MTPISGPGPAIVLYPAPVLNVRASPFGDQFRREKPGFLVNQGSRAVETMLALGTTVELLSVIEHHLCEIRIPYHPSKKTLFVDIRALSASEKMVLLPRPPPPDEVLRRLSNLVSKGTRYFWGGTEPDGVPILKKWYPRSSSYSGDEADDAICRGVDCSGLLAKVTDRYLPHSTLQLLTFGNEKSWNDPLQPLDLLVKNGHVMIVSDQGTVIESCEGRGVIETPLDRRIEEIRGQPYTVRAWHPNI